MKKGKLLLLLAFVSSLVWISCKKGDTGPAGAAGATGPAGPDSVVYSAWIGLTPTYIGDSSSGYYSDTVQAPSVTQGILDSGIVLGYVDASADNDASYVIAVGGAEQFGFLETYSLGQIIVENTGGDFTGNRYRYVTIPGSKMEGNSTARRYKGYTIEELRSLSYDKAKAVVAGSN